MAPDKMLSLIFASDQREVAKVTKQGVMLCEGVRHPSPDSEVYCFPREGGIFAKNTNPTVMLTFGSGNFQPEFSVVLPFRRDLLQLLIGDVVLPLLCRNKNTL